MIPKHIMIEQHLRHGWEELFTVDIVVSESTELEVATTVDKMVRGLATSGVLYLTKNDGRGYVITTVSGPIRITPMPASKET